MHYLVHMPLLIIRLGISIGNVQGNIYNILLFLDLALSRETGP